MSRLGCFFIVLLLCSSSVFADSYPGMPAGQGSYQELIGIYDEFLVWNAATRSDYSADAIAERRDEVQGFHARLQMLAVRDWPRDQQADFLAVRARIDQEYFRLHVSRPWARDPGFYVDRMLRLTFAELPLHDDELLELKNKLASIPPLVASLVMRMR